MGMKARCGKSQSWHWMSMHTVMPLHPNPAWELTFYHIPSTHTHLLQGNGSSCWRIWKFISPNVLTSSPSFFPSESAPQLSFHCLFCHTAQSSVQYTLGSSPLALLPSPPLLYLTFMDFSLFFCKITCSALSTSFTFIWESKIHPTAYILQLWKK